MKFSFSTTLLPEIRDLREVASRVAGAGYDGIEWRIHRDYHVDPLQVANRAPELRAICDEFGLAAPCLAGYLDWTQLPEIELMIEAARILDCPRIRLGGFIYDESETYGQVYERALKQMSAVVPLLKAAGVTAVFETHFGTIHASAQGAYQLARHFDPEQVGIVLDGANLCAEGRENWKMMIEVLGPYLQHVHVRNTQWYRNEAGAWSWHWDALDAGMAPWKEIFSLLKARNYQGFITSENMWGIPKRTTGYIGETVVFMGGNPRERSIEERLDDIAFFRSIS